MESALWPNRDLQMGKQAQDTQGAQADVGFPGQGLLVLAVHGRQSFPGRPWICQGKTNSLFLQPLPTPPLGRGEGLCLKSSLCPAGQRWSAACAYLHPALSRPNLTAETRTFVSRVLFEGSRAVGVEYIKNGQSHRVSQAPPMVGGNGQSSCSRLHRHCGGEWAAGGNGLKGCSQGLAGGGGQFRHLQSLLCPG